MSYTLSLHDALPIYNFTFGRLFYIFPLPINLFFIGYYCVFGDVYCDRIIGKIVFRNINIVNKGFTLNSNFRIRFNIYLRNNGLKKNNENKYTYLLTKMIDKLRYVV